MKKLFFTLIILLALIGCGKEVVEKPKENIVEHVQPVSKYNVGDIVYLKPDSTRAVVEDVYIELFKRGQIQYTVYYFTTDPNGVKEKNNFAFDERLIY